MKQATNARRNFLQGIAAAGATTLAAAGSGISAAQAAEEQEGGTGVAAGQSRTLAEYGTKLRYEDIPPDVIQRAKDTITDTVGVIMYGGALPWSKMIAAYSRHNGAGGKSRILGTRDKVHANAAAFSNGAFAHAFELDNLTKPNSGSHPGATMFSSSLAVAQERGIGGRELITAFVAGGEVMIRVGLSTKHSQEEHGFHAPGTTGPFGAAVATGHLIKLNADQMQNAIGLAASSASGLLQFAKSGTGAMVKRLHMGRAAESGVLAASLAEEGFTAPGDSLEGEFGFLRVFCRDYDMNLLTRDLGKEWKTRTILMKRYACHITAHTPVESTLALKAENKFSGEDVALIEIQGTDRAVKVNNIPQPKDILLAQYSIPFCVSLALFRNPVDPRSFEESAMKDERIMRLARTVKMTPLPPPDNRSDMTSQVTITLKDGRSFTKRSSFFMGTPEAPMGPPELREKFLMLTQRYGDKPMNHMFDRLQNIENEKTLDWIGA